MSTVLIKQKDEIVMKLVHYFVTKENYTPIVVTGAKDEIWLENEEGPFRIIRINSNYIHNNEQFDFDLYKTKSILKQIKKKTMSLKVSTMNILLDVNEDVKVTSEKDIIPLKIESLDDLVNNKTVKETFPKINNDIINAKDGMDLIINVTKDINTKTSKENEKYDQVFRPKKIIATKVIIAINIIIFALMYILGNGSNDANTLLTFGAMNGALVKSGEVYRLITAAFIHIGFIHLAFNMYALNVIGSQIESFLGKTKFLLIYFISAISGSILSMVFSNSISAGASGAIFGLLGSLLYFGYHYRMYLGSVLKNQIIPLIILNLLFGFILSGVDNAAHIGGLVGGYLGTMALGIPNKGSKSDRINGSIVLIIFLAFISYMAFIGF